MNRLTLYFCLSVITLLTMCMSPNAVLIHTLIQSSHHKKLLSQIAKKYMNTMKSDTINLPENSSSLTQLHVNGTSSFNSTTSTTTTNIIPSLLTSAPNNTTTTFSSTTNLLPSKPNRPRKHPIQKILLIITIIIWYTSSTMYSIANKKTIELLRGLPTTMATIQMGIGSLLILLTSVLKYIYNQYIVKPRNKYIINNTQEIPITNNTYTVNTIKITATTTTTSNNNDMNIVISTDDYNHNDNNDDSINSYENIHESLTIGSSSSNNNITIDSTSTISITNNSDITSIIDDIISTTTDNFNTTTTTTTTTITTTDTTTSTMVETGMNTTTTTTNLSNLINKKASKIIRTSNEIKAYLNTTIRRYLQLLTDKYLFYSKVFLKYKFPSLYHTLSHTTMVYALNYGTLSFTQLIKAAEPLFASYISHIIFKQPLTKLSFLSLVPLGIGILLATRGQHTFPWTCLYFGLLSNIFSAIREVTLKQILIQDMMSTTTTTSIASSNNINSNHYMNTSTSAYFDSVNFDTFNNNNNNNMLVGTNDTMISVTDIYNINTQNNKNQAYVVTTTATIYPNNTNYESSSPIMNENGTNITMNINDIHVPLVLSSSSSISEKSKHEKDSNEDNIIKPVVASITKEIQPFVPSTDDIGAIFTFSSFLYLLPISLLSEGSKLFQIITQILKFKELAVTYPTIDVLKFSPSASYIMNRQAGLAFALLSGSLLHLNNIIASYIYTQLGPISRAVTNTFKRIIIILISTLVFHTKINKNSIDWSDVINIFSLLAESDIDWDDFDMTELLDTLELELD